MEGSNLQKRLNGSGSEHTGAEAKRHSAAPIDLQSSKTMTLTALPGLPLVQGGDDIAGLICEGLSHAGIDLRDGDMLVIAQKIISKAENRMVRLADVTPSTKAKKLARETDRDPRIVELILSESDEILRATNSAVIVNNRNGLVLANAGIDRSNVCEATGNEEWVLLLPRDPDATCQRLREEFKQRFGVDMAVIINDSIGRAWRRGSVGLAIGAAGLPSLLDLKGRPDLFNRPLEISEEAIADELAAAASLMQGQANEGRPVVLIRGYAADGEHRPAGALVRPKEQDLFR